MLVLSGSGCGRVEGRVDPRTGSLRVEGSTDLSGRPDGEWTWWYPDGTVRERGTFDAGRRVGRWTRWDPNGQRHSEGEREPVIAEASDPDALRRGSHRTGEWRLWFSNGQLRGRGRYERGRLEGPWTWWDHEGELDPERTGADRSGERVPE